MSLLRSAYSGLSWVGTPFIAEYLKWRARKGCEDKSRLSERFGKASKPRPQKPIVWIHGVSVGESVAALTILSAILKKYPNVHGLLTTSTVSSAKVIEKKLPRNMTHQYCPIDTPFAVKRFLNHWQPDLAIWTESELWPNLIYQTQARGIPTILLNGRMSRKSFASWRYAKGMIEPLLRQFSLCAVQGEDQARYFKDLGAQSVAIMNNAKLFMTPLDVNLRAYKALKKAIGPRPLWLAASTHEGEEELVFEAHKILKKDYPSLLTIVVPRHIKRAAALSELATQKGLTNVLRTQGLPLPTSDIYIGDTLGELSLFYALSPVVLMGATFVPKGGHNPIEAAQFGTFVLNGPHTFNNAQLYETLASLGLSQRIRRGTSLASQILPWLKVQKETYGEPENLKAYRKTGTESLLRLLRPYLQELQEKKE